MPSMPEEEVASQNNQCRLETGQGQFAEVSQQIKIVVAKNMVLLIRFPTDKR